MGKKDKSVINRRDFLTETSQWLGLVSLATVGGSKLSRQAFGTVTAPRRHLINMVAYGGWDSQWSHKAMPAQEFADQDREGKIGIFDGYSPCGHRDGAIFNFSRRFGNEAAVYANQPELARLGHVFGPAWNASIDESLRNGYIAVAKGLIAEGGHTIGNRILQHGTISSYAISYSGLIAESLTQIYPRPLHYAMRASTPDDLFTNIPMAAGLQVPVCLPGLNEFQGITSPVQDAALSANRRAFVDGGIRELAGLLTSSSFKLGTSKSAYDAFQRAFDGSVSLAANDVTSSVEFAYIWKSHWVAQIRAIRNLYADSGAGPTLRQYKPTETAAYSALPSDSSPYCTLPDIRVYQSKKALLNLNPNDSMLASEVASLKSTLINSLSDFRGAKGALTNTISDGYARNLFYNSLFDSFVFYAYSLAFAEYLVTYDLSAVVEVPFPAADFHTNNLGDLLYHTQALAGFSSLIRNLKAAGISGGSSMMDVTTIAMHTEFDRGYCLSALVGSVFDPGTDHGVTSSVLLAGAGVKAGQIFGDLYLGPISNGLGIPSSGVGITEGLPINASTGRYSSAGAKLTTSSLFPTLLALYGAKMPDRQITNAAIWKGILK